MTTFKSCVLLALTFQVGFNPPTAGIQRGPTGKATNGNVVYIDDLKPRQEIQGVYTVSGKWISSTCRLRGAEFKRSILIDANYNPLLDQHPSPVLLVSRRFEQFEATVGIEDRFPTNRYAAIFTVIGDGKILFKSPRMIVNQTPERISLSIKDVVRLELRVEAPDLPLSYFSGNDPDEQYLAWGDARLMRNSTPVKSADPSPGIEGVAESTSVGNKVLRLDPEKLKELASELKSEITADPELTRVKPTLAIAAFKLVPAESLALSNADNVREDLTTALIKIKAFDVVERSQLEKTLSELQLGLKDTFDSANAQKLGKLVNARMVMIGSISDRGGYAVINARLIDTETGRIRIAAMVEIKQ